MKNYLLGLDVGTNSIGYAVTDEQYNSLKYKNKRMVGVSLFNEAELKKQRRLFRSARRRLNRRKQRSELIKELFAREIAKVDEQFFIRLSESALWQSDKSCKNSHFLLFNNNPYTDKQYYKKYPTIHHLIFDLINDKSPKDVRLVYLAVSWLVKNRGHFLSYMDESDIDITKDFKLIYEELVNMLSPSIEFMCSEESFKDTLKANLNIKNKKKEFKKILEVSSSKKNKGEEDDEYSIDAIIGLLSGGKVKLKSLFLQKAEDYSKLGSISLEEISEDLDEIGDDKDLILVLKRLFDWAKLVDILGGEKTVFISQSKVKTYNQHKNDLRDLKKFALNYGKEKELYDKIFESKGKEKNYAAYIYSGADSKKLEKAATRDEFYSFLKENLKDVQPLDNDKCFYDDMFKRIDKKTFLPKQKVGDNSVIPYQLQLHQLNAILNNAQEYLPFLSEVDENGISVAEKIRMTFKFRIPYFVGVTNEKSEYSWLKFKNKEKIYPWNIESVVDYDKSEEAFISKMVGACTYLPSYKVMPKSSLVYQKFEVLNELNNLKVNGEMSIELKQKLFEGLFCKEKVVSKKRIGYYMTSNYGKDDYLVTGIDVKIKSSLKSYHDFKKLLTSGALSEPQIEEAIARITSTNDKNRLLRWLKSGYPTLSETDRKYIANRNYKDYGRLSKEFLTELVGANKDTGEAFTIMEALWKTNDNLMQLLSDKYSFREEIERRLEEKMSDEGLTLDEKMDALYLSSPVKRQVRKSLEIVNEIVKLQGAAPSKIFIEMARGGTEEQKGKRTKSRKDFLMENINKDIRENKDNLEKYIKELDGCTENQLQSEKLYLYFTQLGRCIYTGKQIDIESILKNKGDFDIDHIWPRSKIADDSLNNKVLSDRIYNRDIKKSEYPIKADTRSSMRSFWEQLKATGLISDVKFDRLTRETPFTDEERWGFINRQLVETRQSTKALTGLLKEKYPGTEIVFVKAKVVSEFRHEYKLIKSRAANVIHHASDAYLNIVVGNVYHEKFTKTWFDKNKEDYSIGLTALFKNEIKIGEKIIWEGDKSLNNIKNETRKNNIQVVSSPYTKGGAFYDQMPKKAAPGLSVLKNNMPTERYGGYGSLKNAYFILVEYCQKNKKEIVFLPVMLLHTKSFEESKESALAYVKKQLEQNLGEKNPITNISILLDGRHIKIGTMLQLDELRVTLNGRSADSLIVDPITPAFYSEEMLTYIKKLESFSKKQSTNKDIVPDSEYDKITFEENLKLYDCILDKLRKPPFSKRPNNGLETIEKGREVFISKKEDLVGQNKQLLSLVALLNSGTTPRSTAFIGGSEGTCASKINSKLSNLKKRYNDIRIIDQSPTGLIEKQSVNLLKLL